jgi:hypothetical protein
VRHDLALEASEQFMRARAFERERLVEHFFEFAGRGFGADARAFERARVTRDDLGGKFSELFVLRA